ncbi:uncharacterized protein LOC125493251 [Beta vulgaris subsp. vulgaris]|uniref:uncharacterized protein LOC125493251 n=1 Tax=Beta vulgaris subsp. vulgaris TaxID=3555 RepID=UPI002036F816|nr:uncharacterized protein LOC125493251 [Beta vulgaris subsp. vulgaris]
MANNHNALAYAIRLMTKKLTQVRAEHPDPVGDMFERLANIKPPYFKGKTDPTLLESWIREFENIFGTVNCSEGMKVGQVVLYLKDEADLWWKENGKAREFINLRMRSMTISEYYSKFITLSGFAPEVVATEELQAQRFEQDIHIYDLQSRRDKKNRNGNENFQGRNVQDYNNKGQFERTYNHKKCNKIHPDRDCKRDLVTCNYCQRKGHRGYECFTKQRKELNGNGSGNQGNYGFNQLGNQGSKPIGSQNNQGSYSKPTSESNNNQNKTPSKVFVMSHNEAERFANVVSGTFSINSVIVKALFDSRASYSFISSSVIKSPGLADSEELAYLLVYLLEKS